MNEKPTKENTLYLPIKQVYFDQIIAGTKTEDGKTGADWDRAPEQTGTLLMLQS